MMYSESERLPEKLEERAVRDKHRADAFQFAGVNASSQLSDFFQDGDFGLDNALSLIDQSKGFTVEVDQDFLSSVSNQLSALGLEGAKRTSLLEFQVEKNTFFDRKEQHFGYHFVNSFQAFAK